MLGLVVGCDVVGNCVGFKVGLVVGSLVGLVVGVVVGAVVGSMVGFGVGGQSERQRMLLSNAARQDILAKRLSSILHLYRKDAIEIKITYSTQNWFSLLVG